MEHLVYLRHSFNSLFFDGKNNLVVAEYTLTHEGHNLGGVLRFRKNGDSSISQKKNWRRVSYMWILQTNIK